MTQRRSTFRWILIACAIVGSFAMPTNADAAGLLDWLFPRRAERVQRRLQRRLARVGGSSNAYTTGYRGYGGTAATNGYAYQPGTWNGWSQIPANSATAFSGLNSGWSGVRTAGYAPTTSYRTVWTPVPVTTYKPSASGCQTPCNSYSWQARRVPYTTYQPSTGFANVAPTLPATTGCDTCTTTNYGSPAAAYVASNANANGNTVNYGSDWSWASSGNSGWNTVTTGRPRYTSAYNYANGSPYATGASASSSVTALLPERTVIDTRNATQWAPVQSGFASAATADGSSTRTVVAPQSGAADAGGWVPVQSGAAAPAAQRAGFEQSLEPTPDPSVAGASEWKPADQQPTIPSAGDNDGWVPQTRYDRPGETRRQRAGYDPIPPARTETGYRAAEVDEEPRYTAAEWREIQEMRRDRELQRQKILAIESERQDYLDQLDRERLERQIRDRERDRDQAAYDRYGYGRDRARDAEYRDEVRARSGFENSVYRAPRALPERDTEGGWSYDRVNRTNPTSWRDNRYTPVPSTTAPVIPRRESYQPRNSYPSYELKPIPEPRDDNSWDADKLIQLSRPREGKVSLASLERWEAKPITARRPVGRQVQTNWRSAK